MPKVLRCLILALLIGAPGSAYSWSFQLGAPTYVKVNPDPSPKNKFYIRDGRFSVLATGETDYPFMVFYPGFQNMRLLGASQYLEDMQLVSPADAVSGGESTADVWNNGGMWMTSVNRITYDTLMGVSHAEYHWYPHVLGPTGNNIARMSIAISYSDDDGVHWGPPKQILTHHSPIPPKPEWGGVGNPCALLDETNNRWMMWYSSSGIRLASSPADATGRPTTWKKWYVDPVTKVGGFTQPGLGGLDTPLSCLSQVRGGVPSVHWNPYLEMWIMVFHTYAGQGYSLFIAGSRDGVNWDCPRRLVTPPPSTVDGAPRRAWYPTIIGPRGDKRAGRSAHLYYLDMQHDPYAVPKDTRNYVKVPITFSLD